MRKKLWASSGVDEVFTHSAVVGGCVMFGEVICEIEVTEFRQPLQVQSHLEMPGILVQLGHTQRT